MKDSKDKTITIANITTNKNTDTMTLMSFLLAYRHL